MSLLDLVVFLFLALIFTIHLVDVVQSKRDSTGLPLCKLDANSYLLPKAFVVEKCYIPVSRSYLYSKYNAAFVLSGGDAVSNGVVGETMSFSLYACHLETPSQNSSLWIEDEVVQFPIPLHNHTELCESTDFYFLARAFSEHSIELASVVKIPRSCEWEISFKPAFTGPYSLEVVNTWINGAIEPNREACEKAEKNKYWVGTSDGNIPFHLQRGPPWMECCDRCQLYESCKYWTMNYTKDDTRHLQCYLYSSATGLKSISPSDQEDPNHVYFLSGIRKSEETQIYVGGSLMRQSSENTLHCKKQGQVINSPLNFTVAESTTSGSTTLAYKNAFAHAVNSNRETNICSSGDVKDGLWVKLIDSSRCISDCDFANAPPVCDEGTSNEYIWEALSKSRLISTNLLLDGIRYTSHYYHNESMSNLYCVGFKEHHTISLKSYAPSRELNCSFWNANFNSSKLLRNAGIDHLYSMKQPWQVFPQCNLQGSAKHNPITQYAMARFYSPYFEWASKSDSGCVYKHYSYGAARKCLKNARISNILLRGDSVMNGFRREMMWYLKTEKKAEPSISIDETLEIEHDALSCGFAFLMEPFDISNCIESFKKIRKNSLTNVPNLENNTAIMLNFDLQHMIWHYKVQVLEERASLFFKLFKEEKVKGYFKNTTFVFFNGMADHTFREPFCTTQRSQKISQIMGDLARSAGWLVLDAFNMTLLRPDGSQDGMHYGDPINYMFTQVFINMLCNQNK
jgi:hypothetical protein